MKGSYGYFMAISNHLDGGLGAKNEDKANYILEENNSHTHMYFSFV